MDSIDLSLNDTIQNSGSLEFYPLPVHEQRLPVHIPYIPDQLLSNLMLRIPVLEMDPTKVAPEERLTGQSPEAPGYSLDVGEEIGWRDVEEDVGQNFIGELLDFVGQLHSGG